MSVFLKKFFLVAYNVDAVGDLRWHCHYQYHHNNHDHILLLITNLKQFEKELPKVSCRPLPRLALARRTIRTNLASHLISACGFRSAGKEFSINQLF